MTAAAAWCAVGLGAAVLAHRWRHRALRLCVLVVGVAVALALAVALTGEVAPQLFATAARISVATVVLSIVAVLLVVRTLPQLASRNDRHSVVVVFAAVAAMYLAVGAFLAAAAHDGSQVQGLPQLRTRDEFIDRRDSPSPPGAVLLEARVSDATAVLGSGVVASYRCPTIGPLRLPGARDQLPSRYLLDLPGGPPIVAGPTAPDQAWAVALRRRRLCAAPRRPGGGVGRVAGRYGCRRSHLLHRAGERADDRGGQYPVFPPRLRSRR
ncbi:MAG: hypothetical protein WBB57_23415 [Mycobacterium sp.]